MARRRVAVIGVAIAISLSACSELDADEVVVAETSTTQVGSDVADTSAVAAAVGINLRVDSGDIGEFVTVDGATVYGFVNDVAGSGVSTCSGECLSSWPAVPADVGLDPAISAELTSIARDDGFEQAVLNGRPIHFFVDDRAVGDTTGQGVGDKWFAIDAAGGLIGSTDPGTAN